MALGHVAVGGDERTGAQLASEEARQPSQMAVAQPLVLREAHDAQPAQRFEQIARQRRQIVVVQRPVKTTDGRMFLFFVFLKMSNSRIYLQYFQFLLRSKGRFVDASQLIVIQLPATNETNGNVNQTNAHQEKKTNKSLKYISQNLPMRKTCERREVF